MRPQHIQSRILLLVGVLLATTHPLPAPVTVLPEATPSPKTANKPKSILKQTPKPKPRNPSSPVPGSRPVSEAGRLSTDVGGSWLGIIHFTVANGQTFDTPMTADVNSVRGIVTVRITNTSISETVAGRRAGNGVGWSSPGGTSVTEVILRPTSKGTAQVTSRVTRDGLVLATGTGIFSKNR